MNDATTRHTTDDADLRKTKAAFLFAREQLAANAPVRRNVGDAQRGNRFVRSRSVDRRK